jgi:hypothetical protein
MFKAGDKVRRVTGGDFSEYDLYVGNIYTVETSDEDSITLQGHDARWFPVNFVLVESSATQQTYT